MTTFNELFQPLERLFSKDFLISEPGQFNQCPNDKLQNRRKSLNKINFTVRKHEMLDDKIVNSWKVLINFNRLREFYLNMDLKTRHF